MPTAICSSRTWPGKPAGAWASAPGWRALIPHLREPLSREAIAEACEDMGRPRPPATWGILPVRGWPSWMTRPGGPGWASRIFCEWFGMDAPFIDGGRPWPPRCRPALEQDDDRPVADISVPLEARCAPAGHALYSTAPEVLRDARQWCADKGRVFALHLAESPGGERAAPERERAAGRALRGHRAAGGLAASAPAAAGLRHEARPRGRGDAGRARGPARCAGDDGAGGLRGGALPSARAPTGIWPSGKRRSFPPWRNNVLCCLGTDGLSSNTDLDVRKEAVFLREACDAPPEALLRLLTVNAAEAPAPALHPGRLEPGAARQLLRPAGSAESFSAFCHGKTAKRGGGAPPQGLLRAGPCVAGRPSGSPVHRSLL